MKLEISAFIEARALSLGYEAINFPQTARTALRWLYSARSLAAEAVKLDTAGKINTAITRVAMSAARKGGNEMLPVLEQPDIHFGYFDR